MVALRARKTASRTASPPEVRVERLARPVYAVTWPGYLLGEDADPLIAHEDPLLADPRQPHSPTAKSARRGPRPCHGTNTRAVQFGMPPPTRIDGVNVPRGEGAEANGACAGQPQCSVNSWITARRSAASTGFSSLGFGT